MFLQAQQLSPMPETEEVGIRRPRIAIMGEFSAGKSTLTNLLMSDCALPTRITATQLPPVWLSHGDVPAYGERLDGSQFPVDLEGIGPIDLETTRHLRVFRSADVLELCDLIDFPGISDPNMDCDVWQRVLPLVDAVLWCTHATQAWRQSEAAVWDEMPPELHERSLLLLTRIDRVSDERDRRRVVARVARETEGLFSGIYPVSLTRALAAGEDQAAWHASGAEDLMQALLSLVMQLSRDLGHEPPIRAPQTTEKEVKSSPFPRVANETDRPAPSDEDTARVTPRRVRPALAVSPRPTPDESATPFPG